MKTPPSPYYPPRAGFWSPWRMVWSGFSSRISHSFTQRLGIVVGLAPWSLALSIVLPGFGFAAIGWRRVGLAAIAVCAAALLVFILGFGLPCATTAVAVTLALHSASLGAVLARLVPHWRAAAAPMACVFLLLAIYLPLQAEIGKFLLPVQAPSGVVIVHLGHPVRLDRGEVVAYRISSRAPSEAEAHLYVHDGIGLERLLAQPGDAVEFTPAACLVNGSPIPRREHMPAGGSLILGPDQWLAWTSFAVRSHGMKEEDIAAAFLAHSLVSRRDILGIPLRNWFWRRAVLP